MELIISSLSTTSTRIASSAPEDSNHDTACWRELSVTPPHQAIEYGAVQWTAFLSLVKITGQGFTYCNNQGKGGLLFSFNMWQKYRRNFISLSFIFNCEAPRNPSCTHFPISEITYDVTNTSFTDWKTECQQLDSDVSTLKTDGTSKLQHFRAKSCIRLARQTIQLCFTSFGSHHYFHPATNSTSVNHSNATNTTEVTVDVSHWYFFVTKNSITAYCLYDTSLTDSIGSSAPLVLSENFITSS